jgi:hypothetical protein
VSLRVVVCVKYVQSDLADYGIVGDLFTVLPQLTEEINTRKG